MTLNYYLTSATYTCVQCQPAPYCITCLNATAAGCTQCSLPYDLYNSACTLTNACPSIGYYLDTTSRTCKLCDTSCYQCSSNSSSNCTACASPYYLINSKCALTCPYGYITLTTSRICQASPGCGTYCLSCYDNNYTCTACIKGAYLYISTCYMQCPMRTYPIISGNIYHGTCLSCDPSCLQCVGPNSIQCTFCNSGNILNSKPVGSCVPICIGNTSLPAYPVTGLSALALSQLTSSNFFTTCSPCHSSCKTCVGWTSIDCNSCYSSYNFSILNNSLQSGNCTYIPPIVDTSFNYYLSQIGFSPMQSHVAPINIICFGVLVIVLFAISIKINTATRIVTREEIIDHIVVK